MQTPTPMQQAATSAGGLTKLAALLGLPCSRVGNWYSRGIPLEFAGNVENLTGVRAELSHPNVVWTRGPDGKVTGYHVPLVAPSSQAAA